MLGWKLVAPQPAGVYPSAYTRNSNFVVTYALNFSTARPSAPLFFFADDLQPSDLLAWGLHQDMELVLLRVEARPPIREMRFCADETSDFGIFWQTVQSGGVWPSEKAFSCPPKTHVSVDIVPRLLVWKGSKAGREGEELLAEIGNAMEEARRHLPSEPSSPEINVFFPTIST